MIRFRCLRCSHCCFFSSPKEQPILLEEEVRRLKELGRERGVKLEFIKVSEGLYRWVIWGYCPFYDVTKRECTIYGERPLACRMFPLLINPQNGEVSVSRACDWVRANFKEIVKSNPWEVFPEEMKATVTVFKRLRNRLRV